MENDDFAAPIYILMIAAACHIICNNQRGRRTWVRPWIQLRREVGAYHTLMRELEQEDERCFKNFVRMNKEDFEELLHRVSPLIKPAPRENYTCTSVYLYITLLTFFMIGLFALF
jgi:hypothetical protein